MDYVDPKSVDPKGVKINICLLGTTNPGLEELAKSTGGFAIIESMYNRY